MISLWLKATDRALLQVASLERLPPPSDFSLEGLRKWLGDERLKNDFPQLRQMHTWDKQYDGDFILLANADKEVPFSFVFQKWVLGPLFRHLGPEKKVLLHFFRIRGGALKTSRGCSPSLMSRLAWVALMTAPL